MITYIFLEFMCLFGGIAMHYAGFEIIKYALSLSSWDTIVTFLFGIAGILTGIIFYSFFIIVGNAIIAEIKERFK